MAILEAMQIYSLSFHEALNAESNSSNTITWVSNLVNGLWNFQYIVDEIRVLSYSFQRVHIMRLESLRSTNDVVDMLAK